MSACVLSAFAQISPVAENVEQLWHALKNDVSGLFAADNTILKSLNINGIGFIGDTKKFNQTDYHKKFNLLLDKTLNQIAPQLSGVQQIDYVYLTFGIPDLRLEISSLNPIKFSLSEQIIIHKISEFLKKINIKPPVESNFIGVDAACASSTIAISLASEKIKSGQIKNALILSIDLITDTVLKGLHLLGVLATDQTTAPEKISRPFSANRTGFVRSESSCALFLETYENSKIRNQTAYIEILSSGISCDAEHITAGSQSGQGIVSAVQYCIENIRIPVSEIQLVKAHGTGTLINDRNESVAMNTVFKHPFEVYSAKGQFGHMASASGAFELIICVYMFANNLALKSWNSEDLDLSLNLKPIIKTNENRNLKYILFNSSGFGGHNCCLLLKKINQS